MKITFVSHSSSLLGASRSILPIIGECKRQGMTVEVLSHGRGPFVLKIANLGLNTRILLEKRSKISWLRNILRFLFILPNFALILWQLSISRPDLLYVNTIDKALPVLSARLLRIPCVVHVREGDDYIHSKNLFRKMLSKIIFDSAHHFICVSQETTRSVKKVLSRKKNSSKCICVYNGISLDHNAMDDFRVQRYEDIDAVRIGFVGGGSHRKRLDIFLEGLALAQKRDKTIHGIVVGPTAKEFDDALKSIDENCQEDLNVQHFDFQENIHGIMSSLDILCLTSDVEAFGRVIIEAALFNVPVIASDVSGPSEIILNNVSGLLFSRGNASDLAKQMITLSEHPELRREFRQAMKTRAVMLFSEEKYVAQCINEIQIYGSV